MDMNVRKLSRPRFVRFTDAQDEELVRRADAEGCTVSVLLRRAAIQTFALPTNGRNTSVMEQERPDGAAVTEEVPGA
jgi:hypothetical protein